MDIFEKYVLRRIVEVAELIVEDPFRNDFGGSDIPTLIALVFIYISLTKGNKIRIIERIGYRSSYTLQQIEFVLDQYTGVDTQHHFWRRSRRGRYYLLT